MFPQLLLLFIIVPVIELILLFQVGARIGPLPTLGIIIITAIIGARLTRAQGAHNMQRARTAMNEGRMPHQEVLDGMMIIIAGVLLITPGLLTDALGFTLLFPSLRAKLRKRLAKSFNKRVQVVGRPANGQRDDEVDDDSVIEAEIIED